MRVRFPAALGLQRPCAGCVTVGAQIAQLCAHRSDAVTPRSAAPNGGDGRVHVLGRWSHSVSTRGRGVLACPTSCAEPIDGSATFTHGDELGCPRRAQRSRRFGPGIVVCHPGGGSPVWAGSRWGGASFPFKNARLSGSHLCPSWYRSPVRPLSPPPLLQPGRRDGKVVAPLPASWGSVALAASVLLGSLWVSRPGGRLVCRVALQPVQGISWLRAAWA
jgi:hypothetical protein